MLLDGQVEDSWSCPLQMLGPAWGFIVYDEGRYIVYDEDRWLGGSSPASVSRLGLLS